MSCFTDSISFDSPSLSVLALSCCCPIKPLSGARLPYTHRQPWSPQYSLRSEITWIGFPLSALEDKLCKATYRTQCCIKWSACRLKLMFVQENAKWESLGDDSVHCSTSYIPAEQCFLQNVHAGSLRLVHGLQLPDARISLSLGRCQLLDQTQHLRWMKLLLSAPTCSSFQVLSSYIGPLTMEI